MITSKATGRTYDIDERGLAHEIDPDFFDETKLRREAELDAWESGGRDAYHSWDNG